jgi:dTDP-4-dehydrorhamnose 3,5-epimerase-like enzyme
MFDSRQICKDQQGSQRTVDTRSKDLRTKYLANPIFALEQPFADKRGAIFPIVDEAMQSCVLITSVKGSVRANHYHETDWHYCYVLSGEIAYYWRETGDTAPPSCVTIKEAQCFFTPPLVDHAMVFLQDTTFLTLGRNPRDQKTYEADVRRIALIEA